MTVNDPIKPANAGLSGAQRALFEQRLMKARDAGSAAPASSIPRRPEGKPIPLSFAQERLWFLYQMEPASPVYNLCQAVRMNGALDVPTLERTMNEIVRRHEALRTNFTATDGRAMQVIAPSRKLKLEVVDLGSVPADQQAQELERRMNDESRRPFNLTSDLLLRACLFRLSATQHVLELTMHHIVSDGWSIGILFRELSALYAAFRAGQPSPLPELPVQYADFAHWERDTLQGPALEKPMAFWKKQLEGELPVLDLPFDHPHAGSSTSRGGSHATTLPLALSNGLKALSQQEGATLFMTLLAGFEVLLHRWCGQDDVVIGSVVAGRRKVALEKLVGFFVSTLVFRGDLSGDPGFRALLNRVKASTLDTLAHEEMPFSHLVRELQPDRAATRNPLFQVMFILQSQPMATASVSGLNFESIELETGTAKFDLTLSMMETPQGLRTAMEYNADLFDAATIERLLASFQNLLTSIVANPDTTISRLPLLTAEERHRIVVDWNQTALDYRSDACVHTLFEEHVQRTPDAIAVVAGRERVTYSELNRRANRIAQQLRARGVGPDVPVGLLLERSSHLLASMLGVLKAGGAYVPLDPAHPAQRLGFLIEDTRMPVVITQRSLARQLPPAPVHVVLVDEIESTASTAGAKETSTPITVTSANLAYIIFTSGSTGQPKGVCLPHRGVVALAAWAKQLYTTEELGGLAFTTAATFDVSVFESLVPLCLGGKILLADNILRLPEIPALDEVRLISGVPSAMAELVRAHKIPAGVTTVNVAGEPCPQSVVESLYALPHIKRVVDVYGPTETTVYSTGSVRRAGGRATIGRPLPNEHAYILDRHQQPVPVGVRGELYIGGDKLARGYLNREELTREKFFEIDLSPVGRMRVYRTGDAARFLDDGSIEFLGRLDHQVKIRGYRIELGEIDTTMARHPAVAESVTVARAEPGGHSQRLVAYVVRRAGTESEAADFTEELRAHLLKTLPEYMVPAAFMVLEKLPRTSSGKVDRRSLPEPDFSASAKVEHVAPRNTVEELIAEIWTDVLGIKQPGVHDNFFDVGGHSLLAAQVLARVQAGVGMEISMAQFFSAPTVAGIARIVEDALIEEIKADDAAEGAPDSVLQPAAGEQS